MKSVLLYTEDAECELNCKPIGMKYYATLNKTVIDGTECTKPFEYFRRKDNGKAICAEGICKVSAINIYIQFPKRYLSFE